MLCCSRLDQLAILQLGRSVEVIFALRLLDLDPSWSLLVSELGDCLDRLAFLIPTRAQRVALLLQVWPAPLQALSSRCWLASSFSLRSASRSISSCMIRRSTSSSSTGMDVISMRSLDAASSTRSIALSGKNRSAI